MREWWRGGVIYQVYPRSFQDTNGDGVGDLPGIMRRLDHIASLGVDAVWLSPITQSPQADMGYDVSDYKEVDRLFGTLEDFDALVAVGAVVGVGLARGLAALLTSFGIELPGSSMVVSTGAIATSVTVGVVVTVLAAYLPARRAARVAPVAAMRDVAVDTSAASKTRAVVGTIVTALGAALVTVGASSDGAAPPVGAGALLVLAGVVVLGPVVGARFVQVGTVTGDTLALSGEIMRSRSLDVLGYVSFRAPLELRSQAYRALVQLAAEGRIDVAVERYAPSDVVAAWNHVPRDVPSRPVVMIGPNQ